LRLVATDDVLDLMRERIDIAIAIGTTPPATSLVRRHLADWTNIIVAAPAYLRMRGTPRTAQELTQHDFVAHPAWHHAADVLTGPDGSRHRITSRRRATSNNQLTLKQLKVAGCGLCLTVEPEVVDELADGRLVRVMPDWSHPDPWQSHSAAKPSIRAAQAAPISTRRGGATRRCRRATCPCRRRFRRSARAARGGAPRLSSRP
jgi:DNA-binding transcriptional LysR family regulator